MTYGLNSNIKLFESLEDFDSYRDLFFNTSSSGIKDTIYIGPCEDNNNSIYEIRFVSGRNLTCIIRIMNDNFTERTIPCQNG